MKNIFTLYGASDDALLAPRGVSVAEGVVAVSDTANNRVCIWHQMPTHPHQKADVILGQSQSHQSDRNQGLLASASSMQYPSGIWTDGQRLIVADAWNHRVLIWHQLPTQHGQAADVVLGQPNFESNLPNVKGLNHAPTAQSLYWCYGVFVHDNQLFIADTGNRRVLYFDPIPTQNYTAATGVIGQPSFEERDYDNQHAIWPYTVKLSKNGSLMITDTQYYRVLLWHQWKDALRQQADVIFGQPNFESNGQNQYRFKPEANTLNWCYDQAFLEDKILIADTGNSRVLVWNQQPKDNNTAADEVIGQAHFNVIGESSLNVNQNVAPDSDVFYWPFAIHTTQHQLIVADTGNHRIMFYEF